MKTYKYLITALFPLTLLIVCSKIMAQEAEGGSEALISASITMAEVQQMTAKYKLIAPNDHEFAQCLDEKVFQYFDNKMKFQYFVFSASPSATKYSSVAKDLSLIFRPYIYENVVRGFTPDIGMMDIFVQGLGEGDPIEVEDLGTFMGHMQNKYSERLPYKPFEHLRFGNIYGRKYLYGPMTEGTCITKVINRSSDFKNELLPFNPNLIDSGYSRIDTKKKTITKVVPILGTGFSMNYSSEFNSEGDFFKNFEFAIEVPDEILNARHADIKGYYEIKLDDGDFDYTNERSIFNRTVELEKYMSVSYSWNVKNVTSGTYDITTTERNWAATYTDGIIPHFSMEKYDIKGDLKGDLEFEDADYVWYFPIVASDQFKEKIKHGNSKDNNKNLEFEDQDEEYLLRSDYILAMGNVELPTSHTFYGYKLKENASGTVSNEELDRYVFELTGKKKEVVGLPSKMPFYYEPFSAYRYKAELFGFGGWVPSVLHFLDIDKKVLFKGTGEKVRYSHIIRVGNGEEYAVVDKDSGKEVYYFDNKGRHLVTRNMVLNFVIYSFQYDEKKLVSITNQFGQKVEFGGGSIKAFKGQTTSFAMSGKQLTSFTDPLGAAYRISYDGKRQITRFELPNDISSTITYDNKGRFESEEYNTQGKISLEEDISDQLGKMLTKITVGLEDAKNVILEILKKEDDLNSSLYNDAVNTISNQEILPSQTEIKSEASNGVKSTTSYDNIVMQELFDQGEDGGIKFKYESDNLTTSGTMQSLPMWRNDLMPIVKSNIKINESGESISCAREDKEYIFFNNFLSGNPLEANRYEYQSSVAGQNSAIIYNSNNGFLTVNSGRSNDSYRLDHNGQITVSQKAGEFPVFYSYDSAGNMKTAGTMFTGGDGSSVAGSVINFTYDSFGYLKTKQDFYGNLTRYTHDEAGNMLSMTLPNSDHVQMEYTNTSALKEIRLPSGAKYSMTRGRGDRVDSVSVSHSMPSSTVSQSIEFPILLGSSNLPNSLGQSTHSSYSYDSKNRLSSVTTPNGDFISISYGSSPVEHVSSIGGISFSVDKYGRTTQASSPSGVSSNYSWVGSQLKSESWSSGGSVNYNFESSTGRVSAINVAGVQASYSYQSDGRVSSISTPNGVIQFSYLGSGNQQILETSFGQLETRDTIDQQEGGRVIERLSLVRTSDAETPQLTVVFSRKMDNFGNVREFKQFMQNSESGVYNNFYSLTPEYDTNNKLVKVERSFHTYLDGVELKSMVDYRHYDHGVNGNRTKMGREVEEPYLFDASSVSTRGLASLPHSLDQSSIEDYKNEMRRYTSERFNTDDQLVGSIGSMNRLYTYDKNGNRIKEEIFYHATCASGAKVTTFEYDKFNNLTDVNLPYGQGRISYDYDARNRRVAKRKNGVLVESYIWYDAHRLAAVLSASGDNIVYLYDGNYEYGDHVPRVMIKGGKSYQIIRDPGLGSVRLVIDVATKQVMQKLDYDEYGNIMDDMNPDFQPLMYAGGLYDSDTKLYRFGARDYDPTIGRWTTKDPIGLAGGLNQYEYAGGNAMTYFDSTGLTQEDLDYAVSYIKKNHPILFDEKVKFVNADLSPNFPWQLSGYGEAPSSSLVKIDFNAIDTDYSDIEKRRQIYVETVAHELMHTADFNKSILGRIFTVFPNRHEDISDKSICIGLRSTGHNFRRHCNSVTGGY